MSDTTAVMPPQCFLFSAGKFHLLNFSKIVRPSHLNSLCFFSSTPYEFSCINMFSNTLAFSDMRSWVLSMPSSSTFVLETVYSYSFCPFLCLCLVFLCLHLCLCFWPPTGMGVCVPICLYLHIPWCLSLWLCACVRGTFCVCFLSFFIPLCFFFCSLSSCASLNFFLCFCLCICFSLSVSSSLSLCFFLPLFLPSLSFPYQLHYDHFFCFYLSRFVSLSLIFISLVVPSPKPLGTLISLPLKKKSHDSASHSISVSSKILERII